VETPYLDDPIAAAATPPGTSGIAVFRVSGVGSGALVDALLRVSREDFPDFHGVPGMPGYTCVFGHLHDPRDDRFLDEAVVTHFAAPHSYTGEDVVEVAVHGGPAVRRAVLAALVSSGARPAEPGEFTRRAFLNGKLDLAEAEAVMDLISSEAERSRAAAADQLRGAVSEEVGLVRDRIILLLALIEMAIEYPDHDEANEAEPSLREGIVAVEERLARLAATFRTGRLLREGMSVVIAGRPNAGKSSLLNRLAGYDRAIVSEVPGTTRDTVEETVGVEGIPVHLVDTAGLRDSADVVERLGVDRARKALGEADAVLWVVDPSVGKEALAAEIAEALQSAVSVPLAFVAGKNDLPASEALADRIRAHVSRSIPVLPFSALTGEGLSGVASFLVSLVDAGGAERKSAVVLTNARHHRAAAAALDHLAEAREGLARGLPFDVVSAVLREAATRLSEITGDEVSESVVQEIFARFCVGK